MGAAWAALHGGYRGNEYEGPGKEEAVAKLTALYESEGMDLPGEKGRGEGQGADGDRQADGGADVCVCPECGHKEEHERGVPCAEKACPECGAPMAGQEEKANRPVRVRRTWVDRIKDAVQVLNEFLGLADPNDPTFADLFKEAIKEAPDGGMLFKEVGGEPGLVTWTTNAFEDRDEELFSTAGLEKYVGAAEKSGERGQYNLWHIPGTGFADVVWQAVIGRYLVEAGQFTKDAKGQSARGFFEEHPERHPKHAPEGWGCSPEFRYLPEERSKGVYENFWITDRAVLPRMAAANVRTRATGGNIMAISKQQMELGEELLGADTMEAIVEEAEQESAKHEADGVAFKEADAEEAAVEETEQEQESEPEPAAPEIDYEVLAEAVVKKFQVELEPLNEFAGQMDALSARMAVLEKAEENRKEVDATRFQLSLERKRASEAEETVVPEDDELLKQKPKETTKEKTGAANFFGSK
jgi:hypothetical protein